MLPTSMIKTEFGLQRIRRQAIGFGKGHLLSLSFPEFLDFIFQFAIESPQGPFRNAEAPFSTIGRAVSGKNRRKPSKVGPERMTKSQNGHRHPRCWAKIPPTTGPRAGAALVLNGHLIRENA